MRVSLLVSFSGCPVAFATDDPGTLPAATGWDPSWLVEPYSLARLGQGEEENDFEWSESVDLLSNRLDLSPLSVRLHDAPSAVLAGAPSVASYLCTRDEDGIPYTFLTAPVDAAATTWDVETAGTLALGYAWCGQECVLVTAIGSGTITVTRGQLGTRAAPHRWSSRGAAAKVYTSFPGITGRKAILWLYSHDEGTLRPLWRGWVGADPSVEGAMLSVGVEPIHSRVLAAKLGPGFGTLWPEGIEAGATMLTAQQQYNDLLTQATQSYPSALASTVRDSLFGLSAAPYRDFPSFLAALQANYRGVLTSPLLTLTLSVQITPTPRLSVWSDGGAELSEVVLTVGDKSWQGGVSLRNGNQRMVTVLAPDGPDCMVRLNPPLSERAVSLYGTTDYPDLSSTVAALSGTGSAVVQPVWVGDLDDAARVVLRLASVPGDPSTTPFSASALVRPKVPRGVGNGPRFLSSSVPLRLSHEVTATDYVVALQGILSAGEYGASLDPDDWSLSSAPRPDPAHAAVRWYLDQSKSLGDLLEGVQVLYGHALALVDGRLAIRRMAAPLQHEAGTATIYRADLVAGQRPTWKKNRDLVATSIKATLGDDTITVEDARALDDYGPGRTIEVDLSPLAWPLSIGSGQALADELFSQLQDRTAPLKVATFVLSLAWIRAALGDHVTIADDWLLPDGLGGRGITGRVAQVIGKRVSIAHGTVELDLALYGRTLRQGWAPAAKVASASGAALTLALGYVTDADATGGATDYAGSDQPGYDGATASDAGSSFMHVGDVYDLVRLSDGTVDGPHTLAAVSPSTRVVTLDSAPSGGTLTSIAAGDWWDLVPHAWASQTAWQRLFAAIVERSTGLHSDGAGPSRWAP